MRSLQPCSVESCWVLGRWLVSLGWELPPALWDLTHCWGWWVSGKGAWH